MNQLSLTEEERKAVNRSIIRLAKGARFELNVTVSLEHASLANAMKMPLGAILEEGIEAYARAQEAEKLNGTPTLKKAPTIIQPLRENQTQQTNQSINQPKEDNDLPLPHQDPVF